MTVHVSHNQSVLELPPGAHLLAASEKDPFHAFVYGECAWGVQFHPEFDAEIASEYVRRNEEALAAEGQDPSLLLSQCVETTTGPRLLRRFAEIIRIKS
jgi:GMP synthase (glutamine-hydrolysing)